MKIKRSTYNILAQYFSGAFVYGMAVYAIRNISYYQNYLRPQTQATLLYLYILYLIISPFYYYYFARNQDNIKSKPYLFLRGTAKVLKRLFGGKDVETTNDEKVAALFIAVKLFFFPTMVNFLFGDYNSLIGAIKSFEWYPIALTLIFTVDTFIFSLGYAFEFPFMKNVVKSVEPTLLGWLVTIICYPPFNSILGNYIPWGANDYAVFSSPQITTVVRVILVMLLTIYVLATLALGFKASNLTNRGIVTKFPYSIIRHPAYSTKVVFWWITMIPIMSMGFAIGMGIWTFIYFMRAVTEEKHLMQDPDYSEYCKKVRYRFFPGVY